MSDVDVFETCCFLKQIIKIDTIFVPAASSIFDQLARSFDSGSEGDVESNGEEAAAKTTDQGI